jgi:hypothetical protein
MALQNFSWVIPDRLAGSAMPGKSVHPVDAHVYTDLQELFTIGIRCLLSLRDMPEFFGGLCERAGIRWISYPIPDFGVPSDIKAFEQMVRNAVAVLKKDIPLCVHCYAGIGRTGIVLACIVGIYFSIDGEAAIEKVRNDRLALETDEQIVFVNTFLDTVRGV